MKWVKFVLSLTQMIGSIILLFMGLLAVRQISPNLTKLGVPGATEIIPTYTIFLIIFFGALFIIGLIFFLDTLRGMTKEDFAIFKKKQFWIVILILVVLIAIYLILGTFTKVAQI